MERRSTILTQLVLDDGSGKETVFTLDSEKVILGRDPFSDIVLKHPEISRHHASLVRRDYGYDLQDMGSTNGTFVDGHRLGSTETVCLQSGQEIALGQHAKILYTVVSGAVPLGKVIDDSPAAADRDISGDPQETIEQTSFIIPVDPKSNPYIGPRTFEIEERQYFYGRDAEVAILEGQVMTRRLSLFFAQSGAGKSSLLRAGLVPKLTKPVQVGRGRSARIVQKMQVMPILNPEAGIPSELSAHITNIYVLGLLLNLLPDAAPDDLATLTLSEGIAVFFESGQGDDDIDKISEWPTLLIIDQFEELFTRYSERWEEREDFFQQLVEVLDEYPRLHILLTMREDFIAELTPYANLLPDQLRSRFRLERFRRESALAAIKRPAERAGRIFADGVAEELVDNLRRVQPGMGQHLGRPDDTPAFGAYIEPVHLQIVCRRLWQKLPLRRRIIEADDIHEFGDVDEALIGFYESTLGTVTAQIEISERALRDWFNEKLITPAHTRGLVYRGSRETDGLANEAVEILEDAYIVRATRRAGDVWYELVHDRLVAPIINANQAWRSDYSNPLDRASRAWVASGRNVELLLDGAQLAEAQLYMDEHSLDIREEEREFLRASQRAEKARRQRERVRRIAVIVGLLVVIALLILSAIAIRNAELAEQNQRKAESQAAIARSRELAALSSNQFNRSRFGLALLLAIEAGKLADNPQAYSVLQQAATAPVLMAGTLEHDDEVRHVGWSPGGDKILTASWDGTARVWDARNGDLILSLLHNDRVTDARWSRDGARILTAGLDETVKVWDSATGLELLSVETGGAILQAQWNSDETMFITSGCVLISGACDQGRAIVFDADSGAELFALDHDDWVNDAYWNDTEELIATASDDGTAKIWDSQSGLLLAELGGHRGDVNQVVWGSGNQLLSAGDDGLAIVWTVDDQQVTAVLEGHEGAIEYAAWDRNKQRVLTVGSDATVRIWDATSGQPIYVLRHGVSATYATWNSDDQRIISTGCDQFDELMGCANGTARIWDVSSGREVSLLAGHGGTVTQASWNEDGDQVLTASRDGSARIWSTAIEPVVPDLNGHQNQVMKIHWNNDNKRLLSLAMDGFVKVWDVANGDELLSIRGGDGSVLTLDANWSPDEKLISTTTIDGEAKIWDSESGRELHTLRHGRNVIVYQAVWNSNGTRILTTGDDGRARVWDANRGEVLLELTGHRGEVTSASWSIDDSLIATGDENGTVRIFDSQTGSELAVLSGHNGSVVGLRWSANGDRVLSFGPDGTVKLWKALNGEEIASIQAHQNGVIEATWNKDETVILTAGCDARDDGGRCVSASARLWDYESGGELLRVEHQREIWQVGWDRDYGRIITASGDGTAKIWSASNGTLLFELRQGSEVRHASWSGDANLIVTGNGEGEVGLAFGSQEGLLDAACRLAVRNMTQDEWSEYMGDAPYSATCADLSVPSLNQ